MDLLILYILYLVLRISSPLIREKENLIRMEETQLSTKNHDIKSHLDYTFQSKEYFRKTLNFGIKT